MIQLPSTLRAVSGKIVVIQSDVALFQNGAVLLQQSSA